MFGTFHISSPNWPQKLKNVTVTHGGPNWPFRCLDFWNTFPFCISNIFDSLNSGFSSSSNVYITATRKWCPVLKAALGGDPEIASTVLVHQWQRIYFPQWAILTEESLWCFYFVFFLYPQIATSVLVHQRFVSLQQEQSWLSRAFDVAVRSFKLALAIFLWNNLVQPAFLSHTIHLTTFEEKKWHRHRHMNLSNKVTFQLQNVAKFAANFKGFQKGGEKDLGRSWQGLIRSKWQLTCWRLWRPPGEFTATSEGSTWFYPKRIKTEETQDAYQLI